jgi:toxin ParE1/3/4
MSRRVVRTPEAKADLIDVYVFIGQRSLDAANRSLRAADTTFERLAARPGVNPTYETGYPAYPVVRVATVDRFKKYLIFYRPIDDGIEVLRVVHGARDLGRLFRDDDQAAT